VSGAVSLVSGDMLAFGEHPESLIAWGSDEARLVAPRDLCLSGRLIQLGPPLPAGGVYAEVVSSSIGEVINL